MPAERLTQRRIETAKCATDKILELRDEIVTGLELRISPGGSKRWSFNFSIRALDAAGNPVFLESEVDGAMKPVWLRRRKPLGVFPGLSLDHARDEAVRLRQIVAAGYDPIAQEAAEAVVAQTARQARLEAVTLEQLVARRLAAQAPDERLAEATRKEYGRLLKRDFLEAHGTCPATDITEANIVAAMDRVVVRQNGAGGKRTADHLKAAISSVFAWGIEKRLVAGNPAEKIPKRVKKAAHLSARKRVLTDTEIGRLWQSLTNGSAEMGAAMRSIVMLSLLTGQRRLEVCGARRDEIIMEGTIPVGNADAFGARMVEAPVWIISGDVEFTKGKRRGEFIEGRTKNGKQQIIPLSTQAAVLFKMALSAHAQDYVFPSGHTVKVGKVASRPHINEDSVTKAILRLRASLERSHAELRARDRSITESPPLGDATVHDLRRTMATVLGELGVRDTVIERLLNHSPNTVTRIHYDHSRLLKDLRTALQLWADYIEAQARDMPRT
jgi:integrase